MKKLAIVFWSGTGNTEKMAQALAEEAGKRGWEVDLKAVDSAAVEEVALADAVALGCAAMGAEVLEEGEMQPFVDLLTADHVRGKKTILFGSYDWGDGEWMRNWAASMRELGAQVIEDGWIAHLEPDADALARGATFVEKLDA